MMVPGLVDLYLWPIPLWTRTDCVEDPPAEDITSYAKLKEALLDWYGVTEDLFHHRFRAVRYSHGCQPRALLSELKEVATQWLKPTIIEGQSIVEKVVSDHIMPPEARVWVL